MKQVAIWVTKHHSDDRIFDIKSPYNRDDCLKKYRSLKEKLLNFGFEIHTQDFYKKNEKVADAILFLDVPRFKASYYSKAIKSPDSKLYVILSECEVISPRNWDKKRLDQFDGVFTWAKKIVDNEKYIHIGFVSDPIKKLAKVNKDKFCALIAGNKSSTHPFELYSEREKAIRWFEENRPKEFDLYGVGWDEFFFKGPFLGRVLNRIKFIKRIFSDHFPSYRGEVKNKFEVLKQYKFSICFENAKQIDDYITEKIFDSFHSYCVPVYSGAPNIEHYVPSNCYISINDFSGYKDLYLYLNNMTDSEYSNYLENISIFLKSEDYYLFTSEYFSTQIAKKIFHDA
ncbi:glycosyltransferase family 10 domain-containing protein [Motiliproteus sp. MSK22-1]|uniref:glycosyltransferase family 10 domain-containing protein n=1 Tax=Motiliproteus sp. MSK22-1 TaxID=1897630 RepID=UPI000977989F|nr:glycosyltransferase family 10 [Motiliproteus sp. MSK22-1]OMH27018.1 hypothetical protein BGP75_00945 [Motiliproteus sp. MSK22-1]